MKKNNYEIDKGIDKCIKAFSNEVKETLKNNLIWMKVFGSYVKGNFTSKSDIDILLLVKKKDLFKEEKVTDLAYKYLKENSIVISPIIYSEYEYKMNKKIGSFFFKEIDQNGVLI